jgi:hypothetical protein
MRTETLARIACALVVVAAGACGKPGGGDDGGDAVHDQETPPCAPGECEIDGLDSALGCPGVLNPSQLLDYHLTMSASDWSALKADTTNSRFFPARFRCGDEPELGFEIGIRRKRSGGIDKPGLKIDFNEITPDGRARGRDRRVPLLAADDPRGRACEPGGVCARVRQR